MDVAEGVFEGTEEPSRELLRLIVEEQNTLALQLCHAPPDVFGPEADEGLGGVGVIYRCWSLGNMEQEAAALVDQVYGHGMVVVLFRKFEAQDLLIPGDGVARSLTLIWMRATFGMGSTLC